MNIKGITTNILPADLRTKAEAVKDVRRQTQNATDRDADGRQQQQGETPKRHLADSEFQEVLRKLEALPGVRDNNLSIQVVTQDDHRVIFIEDAAGNVVRRLSEADLWTLYFSSGRTTGQLFDKAA